jgi:CBS domain-containing protein
VGSVVDLFRDEIARLPILLGADTGEDSMEVFRRGEVPPLRALQVHNGTVYRWNRPCFGVNGGVAHLRIENRVLPAGPSIRDEVANAAFFFGLLQRLPGLVGDLRREMAFEDARSNFFEAARSGLDSQFRWLGGKLVPARELILEELLPLAREGLRAAGIDERDRTAYLDVIAERAETGRTGAAWLMASAAKIGGARRERTLTALTRATLERQWRGKPVHRWETAEPGEERELSPRAVRVEEAMTTDLLTVRPEEPVDLARSLMAWNRVRHLPVEDREGRLVGILASADLDEGRPAGAPTPVREVMNAHPEQIGPERSVADAAGRMAALGVDYLVVVAGGRLAGILTRVDVDRVTGEGKDERDV